MKPRNPCFEIVIWLALLAVAPQLAPAAPSIGVNFVNGGNLVNNTAPDSLGAAESAGAPTFAQINWNNLGRYGDNVTLNATSGTSAVIAAWDSVGTWNTGASLATGDGKLMHGYLDPNNAGPNTSPVTSIYNAGNDNKPIVLIGGLSSWLASVNATTYSVVVYTDGDTANAGRTAEFWLQAVEGIHSNFTTGADLTAHIFAADQANFAGTYTQATSTTLAGATGGNYIVFTGLSANNFLLRGEENGRASDALSGFQIVADPGEVVPEGFYWKGSASNNWTGDNWASDPAGATPATVPDPFSIVSFATTGAANLSTVLGADQSVSKLALTNDVGAVEIGGTHNLTLGSGGIAVDSGTGPLTINTAGQILLDASQTWINNSAGTLTVTSVISGTSKLTTAGGGTTVLTSANLHTGGTTVQSGTLKIGNVTAFGPGPLVVSGILDINGLNPTTSTLTGNGLVKNSVEGTATFTVDNPLDTNYGGTFGDGAPGQITALVKAGAGMLTIGGRGRFTGDILVSAGILNTNHGIYDNGLAGNQSSVLGNMHVPSRVITVATGATLRYGSGNVIGSGTSDYSLLPTTVLNGGTLDSFNYNPVGPLTLNGAVLTQASVDGANYEGFQFKGAITVGGTAPSFISTTNGKGNHLSAETVFNVADVTADALVDLTVNTPLRNQSGDFGNAAGGLTKSGPGTMSLTGSNTYTGTTKVLAGTLSISSSSPGLGDAAAVELATDARLDLAFAVETPDYVGALRINNLSMPGGTYGALSNASADFQIAQITGTGLLVVPADPYIAWIGQFTTLSGPATGKGADPDNDGLTNLEEFAFNENPENGTFSGNTRVGVAQIGPNQALVLTLPVRDNAVFTGTTPATATIPVDRLTYRIEGSNDLAGYDQPVSTLVSPIMFPGQVTTDAGWSFRSFRLNGDIGGVTSRGPKGFMRAGVSEVP